MFYSLDPFFERLEQDPSIAAVYFYVVSSELALLDDKLERGLDDEEKAEELRSAQTKLNEIKDDLARQQIHTFTNKHTLAKIAPQLSKEFQKMVSVKSIDQGAVEYLLRCGLQSFDKKLSEEQINNLFAFTAKYFQRKAQSVIFRGITALNSFFRTHQRFQTEKPFTVESYAMSSYLAEAINNYNEKHREDGLVFDEAIDLYTNIPNEIGEINQGLIERYIKSGHGFINNQTHVHIKPVADDERYLSAIDRAIKVTESYINDVPECEQRDSASTKGVFESELKKLRLIKATLTLEKDKLTEALFDYARRVVAHLEKQFGPYQDLANTDWLKGVSLDNGNLLVPWAQQFQSLEDKIDAKKPSGEALPAKDLTVMFIDTVFSCALARQDHIASKKTWQEVESDVRKTLPRTRVDASLIKENRAAPAELEICLTDFSEQKHLLQSFLRHCIDNGSRIIICDEVSKRDDAQALWQEFGFLSDQASVREASGHSVLRAQSEYARDSLIQKLDEYGAYRSLRAFFAGETNDLALDRAPLAEQNRLTALPLWVDFSFSQMEKRLQEVLFPESPDVGEEVSRFFEKSVYGLLSPQNKQHFQQLTPYYQAIIQQYIFDNLNDELQGYTENDARRLLNETIDDKLREFLSKSNDNGALFKTLQGDLYHQALDTYQHASGDKRERIFAYIIKPYQDGYKKIKELIEYRLQGHKLSQQDVSLLLRRIGDVLEIGNVIKRSTGRENQDARAFLQHLHRNLSADKVNTNQLFVVLIDNLPIKVSYGDATRGIKPEEQSMTKRLLEKMADDYQAMIAKLQGDAVLGDATLIASMGDWLSLKKAISSKVSKIKRQEFNKQHTQLREQFAQAIKRSIQARMAQGDPVQASDADEKLQQDVSLIKTAFDNFKSLFGFELHTLDLHHLNMKAQRVELSDSDQALEAYLNRKPSQQHVEIFKLASEDTILDNVSALLLPKLQQQLATEECDDLSHATQQFLAQTAREPAALNDVYQQKVLLRQLYNASCEPSSPIAAHRQDLYQQFAQHDKAHARAFLLALKAHIHQCAKDNTYQVGLQWLHGKQMVIVDEQEYAVPRRIKRQYDWITDENLSDEKVMSTLDEVLDIGRKYEKTFFSSRAATTHHFTHFKSKLTDVEDNEVYITSGLNLK